MQFGSASVDISNEDKVFFPDSNITKRMLIDYYCNVSDYLLPHIENRPLTIRRFPNGIHRNGFYQKDIPAYFPAWIDNVEIQKKEGGIIRQVICNSTATLIYLVNQGGLEFHSWQSSEANIQCPDKIVFDLDPPDGNFELAIRGARILKGFLEDELNMFTFPMTSGSKGIHVVSPLRPTLRFDEVLSFAQKVTEYIVQRHPEYLTHEIRKNKRRGKLFIDYLRNGYGQTSVAPYSVRALPGAPVATPLEWPELNLKNLSGCSFNIKNVPKRLSETGPVWSEFRSHAKKLDYRLEQLEEMMV